MVKVKLQKWVKLLKIFFYFTGETKSCGLNVKLLTIESANSVSKQVGLADAYGANLQQLKFNIILAIKVLVTNKFAMY